MPLLCPNCHQTVDTNRLQCPNGHAFARKDGVLALLSDSFGQELAQFTRTVRQFRAAEGKRLLDPTTYEGLPFNRIADFEWRVRAYDVTNLLRELAGRREQRVLDIGAWNGWLSHQLARRGHRVTAVDYFADEFDGLRAKKFYRAKWQAIQMDLTDLTVLDALYDLVIINHGLHFFTDPAAQARAARQKVAPGGILVALGLQIFRNPAARIEKVTGLQNAYRAKYGAEIFLNPTRGYLDRQDQTRLAVEGLTMRFYPQLWRPNLKSLFIKTAPRHYYGVWFNR